MSRVALEDFRAILAALSGRAQDEVASAFQRIDPYDARGASRILQEVLPGIVEKYGDVAAVAALDYFESLREESPGRRTPYSPGLAEVIPIEQARASTRWAVGGLFTSPEDVRPDLVLSALQGVADRLTKAQGRDTLGLAVAGDPDRPRFARVPSGRTTCRFCAMLASRGAVYLSEDTAGGLHEFHDRCDCAVVALYEGVPLPAGYDPDYYRWDSIDLGGEVVTAPGAARSTLPAAA